MPEVMVAKTGDLEPGECKSVDAAGQTVALFNVGGTFYAIDNTCAHRGGPLGEGFLDDRLVTCPWHAWQYDVTTGACTMKPAIKQRTFPVSVKGEEVYVTV